MLRMVLSNRNYKKKRVLENMIFSEAKILSSIYNLSWGGYGKKKNQLKFWNNFHKISSYYNLCWGGLGRGAGCSSHPHCAPSLSEIIVFSWRRTNSPKFLIVLIVDSLDTLDFIVTHPSLEKDQNINFWQIAAVILTLPHPFWNNCFLLKEKIS